MKCYAFSQLSLHHILLIAVTYQARKNNTNNNIFLGEYILTY